MTAIDRDAEALEQVARSIRELGGRCVSRLADAADANQARQLVLSAASGDVPLSGLVNVVGGLPAERWQRLFDYSDETLDALIDTNLKVSLQTSRAFARELCARRDTLRGEEPQGESRHEQGTKAIQ